MFNPGVNASLCFPSWIYHSGANGGEIISCCVVKVTRFYSDCRLMCSFVLCCFSVKEAVLLDFLEWE